MQSIVAIEERVDALGTNATWRNEPVTSDRAAPETYRIAVADSQRITDARTGLRWSLDGSYESARSAATVALTSQPPSI